MRCYRAISTLVLGCQSERKDIINHGVLKVAVPRRSQKQGSPHVAGGAARPSELPQDNQEVLKKLRKIKLGAHIDHALALYQVLSADLGRKSTTS